MKLKVDVELYDVVDAAYQAQRERIRNEPTVGSNVWELDLLSGLRIARAATKNLRRQRTMREKGREGRP